MGKMFVVEFSEDQFNTVGNLLQILIVAGLKITSDITAMPNNDQLADVWRAIIQAQVKG